MDAYISEIQYFCTHDGPGIRTTIFFVGCPLACTWCHNPECSILAEQCMQPGSPIPGKRISAESIVTEVHKELPFYGETGGVTCSGGEPLAQPAAVASVLEGCKKLGITTAVETSLYAEWNTIFSLIPLVDLWIVDVKSMRNHIHMEYTGKGNGLILENLNKLISRAPAIWVRMPIIPGVQSLEDIDLLSAYLENKKAVKRIELIPFHLLGKEKYEIFGTKCTYPSGREPTQDEIGAYYSRLRRKI